TPRLWNERARQRRPGRRARTRLRTRGGAWVHMGTPVKIPRRTYADLYGPTTGDCVRLGDTSLVLEIERDHARYGDEVVFGGGKVIRDGQGQSQATRASGAPDLVITNVVVLDHWGVIKADV